MTRHFLVDVEELDKRVDEIKKTTNEIIAITPALIVRGVVTKYLIIFGN